MKYFYDRYSVVPPLVLANAIIVPVIVVLFFITGCMAGASQATEDAIDCRLSSKVICGSNVYSQNCRNTAFHECMKWKGYKRKNGKIYNPDNKCDSTK